MQIISNIKHSLINIATSHRMLLQTNSSTYRMEAKQRKKQPKKELISSVIANQF